jgi:hypothetical protein
MPLHGCGTPEPIPMPIAMATPTPMGSESGVKPPHSKVAPGQARAVVGDPFAPAQQRRS